MRRLLQAAQSFPLQVVKLYSPSSYFKFVAACVFDISGIMSRLFFTICSRRVKWTTSLSPWSSPLLSAAAVSLISRFASNLIINAHLTLKTTASPSFSSTRLHFQPEWLAALPLHSTLLHSTPLYFTLLHSTLLYYIPFPSTGWWLRAAAHSMTRWNCHKKRTWRHWEIERTGESPVSLGPGLRADSILNEMKTMLSLHSCKKRPLERGVILLN